MQRDFQSTLKRVSAAAVLVVVIFSSAFSFPQTTHASDADSTLQLGNDVITSVANVADKTKGYVLDPLAFAVAKQVLNALVKSTVQWINSGFSGAPSFVTNLGNTLQTTSNSTADSFLSQLASNGSIKSPFQNSVASAVSNSYNATSNGGFFTANPYTLNKTTSNDAAFFNGNFIQGGGLNTWAAAWSSSANNPFGAAQLAQDQLANSVSTAVSNQKSELNFGKGFQSYKGNCNAPTTSSSGATNLSTDNSCSTASIKTPGSVIESQLEKSLGSGVDQLVSAHQFDEIVNALVAQLANQVLGASGLTSVQSASTGGSGYLDQTDSTQTAVSASLATSFAQTLTQQQTTLQQFESEWSAISVAANNAKVALTNSTCSPNAQATIANTVQPIINEAVSELSNASVSIASLTKIQNELPTSTATDSTGTAALSQASADYSALLASPKLPSANDISYAQIQSQPTVTATATSTPTTPATPTLYSELTQITQQAQSCQVTAATTGT